LKAIVLVSAVVCLASVIQVSAVPAAKISFANSRRRAQAKGVSCAVNKSCDACLKAKGKSFIRGEYACWWATTGTCVSKGTSVFHSSRVNNPAFISQASGCKPEHVPESQAMAAQNIPQNVIADIVAVEDVDPPYNFDDKLAAAAQLVGNDKKLAALGAMFADMAVIDCGFSGSVKTKCQARKFASGPWKSKHDCTLWQLYNGECQGHGAIKELEKDLTAFNIKLGAVLTGDDCTAAVGDRATQLQKNTCVGATTHEYYLFFATRHAGVCATFAGALVHAMYEAKVTGHVAWVNEHYWEMGMVAGHEYVMWNPAGNIGDIKNPNDGTVIIDGWYNGLGGDWVGSLYGGVGYALQAGMKTVKAVTEHKGAEHSVETRLSEGGKHTLINTQQVTKKWVGKPAVTMEYKL